MAAPARHPGKPARVLRNQTTPHPTPYNRHSAWHTSCVQPGFARANAAGHARKAPMARHPTNSRHAAEMAFKAATTKAPESLPKSPSLPGVKELVSLRIDRDVLDYFQDGGPGWQERINAALRKAAGK